MQENSHRLNNEFNQNYKKGKSNYTTKTAKIKSYIFFHVQR